MNESQWLQAFAILRLANRLALEYTKIVFGTKKKLDLFYNIACKKISLDTLTPADQLKFKSVPQDDINLICGVSELIPHIYKQYKKMIHRLAYKYFKLYQQQPSGTLKINKEYVHCLADFQSEAYIGLLRAIRNYRDSDTKATFFTYSYQSVRRTLVDYIRVSLSAVGANNPILSRYKKVKEELEFSGKSSNFTECVTAMNLTPKEEKRLVKYLHKIHQEADFENSGNPQQSDSLGTMIADWRKEDTVSEELVSLLRLAELTDLELQAFKAHPLIRSYFNDENYVDVAKKNNVSTSSVNYAMQKACEKFRLILSQHGYGV